MTIYMKNYNLDNFKNKDLYTFDEIIDIIQNLESENIQLKEKLKYEIQDKEDNYRRFTTSEQIDYSQQW